MTIVSAMNGYTRQDMEQYEAMGSNQFQVSIWSYQYDKDGNAISKDYFRSSTTTATPSRSMCWALPPLAISMPP